MCSPSAASHCLQFGGAAGRGCSLFPVPCSPCPKPACSARESQNHQKILRAGLGTDPAAGTSRARPAEGRIGLESNKIPPQQHPKGRGFGHCGSGRASTAPVSSLQGGNGAALPGALTALAALGTSASCRLPAWHRPSPSRIPLPRGWTNPWHLVKGENTGGERISAEGGFSMVCTGRGDSHPL